MSAEHNTGNVNYRLELDVREHNRILGVVVRRGVALDDLLRQALELVLLADRGALYDAAGRQLTIGTGRSVRRR